MGFAAVAEDDAIRHLAACYARACDVRDGAWLASLFAPAAQLVVTMPGTEPSVRTAPEGILAIPERLAAFELTLHFIGNHLITHAAEPTRASGDVYCFAHHLNGREDLVMAIHYADRYRYDDAGWRFDHRAVNVLWTDARKLS
jgi:hypothetical protein